MRAYPETNSHEEIEKLWDDFYSPQSTSFKESFNQEELSFLSQFNDVIATKNWKIIQAFAD
ncbi:hypothetical protein [Arenibacter certesii]|uniref:Uncharacterized protein n=1 Tax=Arenibacter certesii TaxID=228955 RepID=A0A918IM79_9FLAO|nr:hypothetical protein [Arenibacter certesii]GGW21948.1 hypothetical protein GCM10007383_00990 [Arenibacter certesii]